MIFAFLLLLQLVQYNVQGKHYLVETEDENSLEKNSPGQVYEYFLNLCQTRHTQIKVYENTAQIVNAVQCHSLLSDHFGCHDLRFSIISETSRLPP